MALYVAAAVAVLTVVVRSRVAPVEAACAVALVIGAPIACGRLEWRDAVHRRPARWLRRALGVVLPTAVAFGLASGAVTDGPVQALPAVVLVVTQLACVVLAARALRYPLRSELGEMAVEVTAKVRSGHQVGTPAWALPDEVRLTGRDVVVVLRPGPGSVSGIGVRLDDVMDVSVRPARPDGGPWIRLDSGAQYFAGEGDVVEVRHRDGALVVPVCNATAFAEVIRSRITLRQGMPAKN
ncbi:hypothetical protein [Pseudonocardia sp. MH-G8]|uniref:hypothetical protein n=1 Tax=Pseudonocardia sp. MH-G8 TaxID=1854588 RepID=UPI000BA0A6D1|nr:hypothetical protein [Pseudonocardia sp. MH-G8]OZM82255.1 hypothetical protein CFP66_10755 [Pseudonocardia sp. MH-G8]